MLQCGIWTEKKNRLLLVLLVFLSCYMILMPLEKLAVVM